MESVKFAVHPAPGRKDLGAQGYMPAFLSIQIKNQIIFHFPALSDLKGLRRILDQRPAAAAPFGAWGMGILKMIGGHQGASFS